MTVISGFVGGLALFLYGIAVMSDGLKQMAGNRLEQFLLKATKSRGVAFSLGLGITSLIQSSSAVTVMLIGIVDSGILQYARTFFVIMGSNVGTTVTAWLISLNGLSGVLSFLKPTVFAPITAIFGVLFLMSRSEKRRNVGSVIIGFAILIIGMDMMGDAMGFIKDSEAFGSILSLFSNPLASVVFAMLFTAIIQSSSATVGIIQALALSGSITLSTAVSLIIGANIGTCITGIIASFGRSLAAKRVSFLQSYFNLFGGALFLIAVFLIKAFLPDFSNVTVGVAEVAVIHTLFNLITAVLILPFYKQIIRITEKSVK